MSCIPQDNFLEAINLYQKQAENTAAQAILTRDKQDSLQQGGMQEWVLPNLAQIGPTGNVDQIRYESSGTWLYLAKSGSSPGAVFTIEMAGGKSFTNVVPGTKILGKFEGFNVTRTGINAGQARFVIGQVESVDYDERNIDAIGLGSFSVTNSPAQGLGAVAGGANAPTRSGGETGFEISDANAVRVFISAAAGNTITGGQINWWVRDVSANSKANELITTLSTQWFPVNNSEVLPTGNQRAASNDFEVGLKSGFVWPELVGVTTSAGGAIVVTVEVL